jgi:putative RNA 2'-phosphotransferase
MSKSLRETSKFLSYVLRHKPESVGLTLDAQGWARVDELIEKTNISPDMLEEVVSTNDKQRFAFSDDGLKIRANQGHTVQNVELQLEKVCPPDHLYHGTVDKFMESIKAQGLSKMARHHVHLTASVETAKNVASRRGKPVILVIDAALMHKEGIPFYLSNNGVWLTDSVPSCYIRFNLV